MISKKEILQIAASQKVRSTTIDKDWVLGHFVDAIFSIPECKNSLVFKGGTCLKKCRFPEYRFSEDLDFTSTNEMFILDIRLLKNIVKLVAERTEIPLYIQSLENLHFNNQLTGYCAKIKFWGAEHGKNQQPPAPERWQTNIKIEIIKNDLERLFKMIFKQTV